MRFSTLDCSWLWCLCLNPKCCHLNFVFHRKRRRSRQSWRGWSEFVTYTSVSWRGFTTRTTLSTVTSLVSGPPPLYSAWCDSHACLAVQLKLFPILCRFKDHPTLNDRYLLLHLLGRGGFSEVYKVRKVLLSLLTQVWIPSGHLPNLAKWKATLLLSPNAKMHKLCHNEVTPSTFSSKLLCQSVPRIVCCH